MEPLSPCHSLPTDCLAKAISFLELNEFCKMSTVCKKWAEALKGNSAWENAEYYALPKRIRNISWISSRAKHRQNLDELKEKISLALEYKNIYVDDGNIRYKFLNKTDIRDLTGTKYTISRKVFEIVIPQAELHVYRLLVSKNPSIKIKENLLKCIQMGYKPQDYQLYQLNMQNPEIIDIIQIFIGCGVNVLKTIKDGKTIFDFLKETNLSKTKIAKLEQLALVNNQMRSIC